MTVELANYLLDLNKYVVQNDNIIVNYIIDIQSPMSFRLNLCTPDDPDQNLLVDVKESEKKALKISLHHQDNSTQSGLLRVDYYSRHLNPVDIIDTVPEIFIPFAGKWLDDTIGHIHYVVDGYKPLAWAIPLVVDDFPVKKLDGEEDYIPSLSAFFKKINLKTTIGFNHQLRAI